MTPKYRIKTPTNFYCQTYKCSFTSAALCKSRAAKLRDEGCIACLDINTKVNIANKKQVSQDQIPAPYLTKVG